MDFIYYFRLWLKPQETPTTIDEMCVYQLPAPSGRDFLRWAILTEAIPISRTELTQEDIKRLFDYQTHLNEEKIKYKQVIGDILNAFDTREALGWKKAKKIAKFGI